MVITYDKLSNTWFITEKSITRKEVRSIFFWREINSIEVRENRIHYTMR